MGLYKHFLCNYIFIQPTIIIGFSAYHLEKVTENVIDYPANTFE